ncbi:MAG: hypothetical protein AAFQ41_13125 [Cyanobacteria bacterium J06623_7]
MSKASFVPLQFSLGTIMCLYTSPLLAQITSDGTVYGYRLRDYS